MHCFFVDYLELCWKLNYDVVFIHEFGSSKSLLLFCAPEQTSGTCTNQFTVSQPISQRSKVKQKLLELFGWSHGCSC